LGQSFDPLAAVHVANALALEQEGKGDLGDPSLLDIAYLTRLGLQDRLPAWRERCHSIHSGVREKNGQ